MIRRRPTQIFSLAFLDCICCGFGAVILIFVLSIDSQDKVKQEILANLRRQLAAQAAALAKMNISKEDLARSNARIATLTVDQRLKNDSLHSLLAEFEQKLQYEKKGLQAPEKTGNGSGRGQASACGSAGGKQLHRICDRYVR